MANLLESLNLHQKLYGMDHESRIEDHLIEELTELIIKILHKRRERPVSRYDLIEEIADIEICLAYFKYDNQIKNDEMECVTVAKLMKMKQQLMEKANGESV